MITVELWYRVNHRKQKKQSVCCNHKQLNRGQRHEQQSGTRETFRRFSKKRPALISSFAKYLWGEMANQTNTPVSWPGLLLVADEGKLSICQELLGKQFYDFVAHGNDVLISCRDGCKLVNATGQVQDYCSDSFVRVSAGHKFFVGVSPDQKLYSWGIDADVGQLGQGVARKQVTSPNTVNFNTNFVGVSCGEAFTIATDELGQAYSFGENFSRQLGLYSKERSKMHLANAMVEEMIFAPRLIPFTMKSPLAKVSCGKNFAMAITKDGRLFSWGSGDCGQLGTGRCTLKEVPSEVSFGSNNVCVTEVACGDAHVIAVLEDGSGYGWGLNQRGQCGTGDQKVKEHVPTRLHLGEDVRLKSVVAEGLSSAAIDTQGLLYTWGSTSQNRLLHEYASYSADSKDPSLVAVQVPTRVVSEVLEGMEVEKFIFTKNSAAVLVKATLTKAWPLRGPKRSFNQLMLYGFGLWNSSQILVKFVSKVYNLYNPPRSSIGKLTPDGCIVCKPPKFAETGGYTVSLSMDGGKEFFSQTFDIYIYKEPTILRQSPAVIDFRLHRIPALSLEVQGNPQIAKEGVQVKYSLLRVKNEEVASPSKNAAAQRAPVAEFFTNASLHTAKDSEHPESMNSARTNDSKRPGTSDTVFTLDCDEVVFDEDLHGLFELTCQLSFNLQDFAGNLGKAEVVSTICHSFEAVSATPSTYAIAELQRLAALMTDEDENYDEQQLSGFERRIAVNGSSLFPSHKLAKGSNVVGIWSGFKVIEKESSGDDSQQTLEPLEDMSPIPVHCETVDSFSFTLSAQNLKQLYSCLNNKGLIPTPLGFQMLLTFQMESSHGDDQVDIIPLNSPPLSLYFYSESPLAISPVIFKRCDAGQKFSVIPAGTDGFIFNPASALVKVSFTNELLPPLIISSNDLIVDTVYVESAEGEGESPGDEGVSKEKVAKGYSIGFSLPSYADLTRNYSHVEHSQVTSMSVTVALDGISYCTEENAARVTLFSNLAKYTFQPAIPKGGATANSTVGLLLEQYCPPVIPAEKIRVSLYGENVTAGSIVQGTLVDTIVGGQTMSLITFSMPDQPTLSKIGPVMQGKEKLLYVDVSIDGGETYDKAERPMLQMK